MSMAKELAQVATSQILISQSTHRILSEQISNFMFTQQTLISAQGKEIVGFAIQKRKNIIQKNMYNRGAKKYENKQTKTGGPTKTPLGQSKDSRPIEGKDKKHDKTKGAAGMQSDESNFDQKTIGALT